MIDPGLPADEPERLAELRALAILDTPREDAFDNLMQLAASIFGVPIALVSLVDEARQWFKSAHGLCVAQTPRDVSFCTHVVFSNAPLVVEDAARDPRFADQKQRAGIEGKGELLAIRRVERRELHFMSCVMLFYRNQVQRSEIAVAFWREDGPALEHETGFRAVGGPELVGSELLAVLPPESEEGAEDVVGADTRVPAVVETGSDADAGKNGNDAALGDSAIRALS